MTGINIVEENDLIRRSIMGEFDAGFNTGLRSIASRLSWNIKDLAILSSQFHEALYTSKRFREVVGKHSPYSRNMFGIEMDETCIFMTNVVTPDPSVNGAIPVMFGSTDIFPILAESVLLDNESIFDEAGIRIIDHGHQEHIISDLQNYKLPNRVYRHYKRSQQAGVELSLSYVDEDGIAEKLNLATPSKFDGIYNPWRIATSHTAMFFGDVIDPERLDSLECWWYDELFLKYHNFEDYTKYRIILNRSPMNSLYDIVVCGEHSIGYVDMNIVDKDWYWVNTHRIRTQAIRNSLDFNLNDAILCAMILKAQESGAETFNLGFALPAFEYKSFYKTDLVWCKGLRY